MSSIGVPSYQNACQLQPKIRLYSHLYSGKRHFTRPSFTSKTKYYSFKSGCVVRVENVFQKNALHLLLLTNVWISPFSGYYIKVKYLGINILPGAITVSMSTPKPLRFLIFCSKSFMVVPNLQGIRIFAL